MLHHSPIELNEGNINDVSISLNDNNIKIVCKICHNEEHERWGTNDGYLKKRANGIYIVYGSPMSGKSSYVKEHMQRGDIVVDLDKIYEAICFLDCYDKPKNLRHNAFAVRNLLIDNIKMRYGDFNSAWLIGGYPKGFDRNRLASDLGAELIYCEISQAECYARLKSVRDFRSDRKSEWKKFIDEWFESYTK